MRFSSKNNNWIILLAFIFIYSSSFTQFSQPYKLNGTNNGGTFNFSHGDITGNGLNDFIISSKSDGKLYIIPQKSPKVFDFAYSFTKVFDHVYSLEVCDINQDNKPDVFVSTNEGLEMYYNLGNGQFSGAFELLDFNYHISEIDFGDMDNDQNIDILTSGVNQVMFIRNNGSGFDTPTPVVNCLYNNLAILDFNNDNNLDLVVGDNDDDEMYHVIGNGDGTFQVSTPVNSYVPYYLEAIDFDNDGDEDICLGGSSSLKIMENDNGTFLSDVYLETQLSSMTDLRVADVDGDGFQDILFTESSSIGAVKLKKGNGIGFDAAITLASNIPEPYDINIMDLDADGDLDVTFCYRFNSSISWLENTGNGSFSSKKILFETGESSGYFLADHDNDGDKELIFSQGFLNLAIVRDFDQGNFQIPKTLIEWNQGSLCVAEDWNNDQQLDFVVMDGFNGVARQFVSQPGGSYVDNNLILSQANSSEIKLTDIDGDGWKDLLISSSSDHGLMWHQNLNGIFQTAQVFYNPSSRISDYTVLDIDLDGDLDIICREDGQGLFCRRNLSGTWSQWFQDEIFSANGFTCEYGIGDLNGDTLPDIVYRYSYYFNLGNGLFSYNPGLNLSNGLHVEVADIDGDNDLDIIGNRSIGDGICWYENDSTGSFDGPFNISTNPNLRNAYIYDIDQDGDMDVISEYYDPSSSVNFGTSILFNLNNHPYTLKGALFIDSNQNGIVDSTEVRIPHSFLTISPNGYLQSMDSSNNYSFAAEPNKIYNISAELPNVWELTTDSLSYSKWIDDVQPSYDSLNFGYFPLLDSTIVETEITASFTRCNDSTLYWISLMNVGANRPTGNLIVQLNDFVTLNSSTVPIDSIVGNSIYISVDTLDYFEHWGCELNVMMPDFTMMGDTISCFIEYYEEKPGVPFTIVPDAKDEIKDILVCAYDPNDKTASPLGAGINKYIPIGSPIEYLIRFQNTGTDTAFNISIEDEISNWLDITSFEFLGSSHPTNISWNQRTLTFNLENINLPDSNINFMGSQGYVKFKILPIDIIPAETRIYNSANIYFDYNPPIVTNNEYRTMLECINSLEITSEDTICLGENLIVNSVIDGTPLITWNFNSTTYNGASFNWVSDTSGTFSIIATAEDGVCTYQNMKEVTIIECVVIHEIENDFINTYPNPFYNQITLELRDNLDYDISVTALDGKTILNDSFKNTNIIKLDLDIPGGIYLITISSNNQSIGTVRIIKE